MVVPTEILDLLSTREQPHSELPRECGFCGTDITDILYVPLDSDIPYGHR